MIHLFDRVYLESIMFLDTHNDKIIISKNSSDQKSNLVLFQYDNLGSLLSSMSFSNFLEIVCFHSTLKNKKVVIYTDDVSEIYAYFCKHIFRSMTTSEYTHLVKLINYRDQIFRKIKIFDLEKCNKFQDIEVDQKEVDKIKQLKLSFSYEFLFADYLSGNEEHLKDFLKKFHYFLRAWFSEALTDNREMILLNLLNHKFQEQLSFSENDFDITDKNLLKNIDTMKYYADEEVWFRHGEEKIDLSGLSKEKIQGLKNLLIGVYKTCESMETNRTVFGVYDWIECVTKEEMSKTELDEIINYIIDNTFDTACVPRNRFQKINYALILHVMNLKRKNQLRDLSNYRLI